MTLQSRHNVLIVSDNILTHSGVANQSAEVVKGLFNRGYGVFQIGVSTIPANQAFLYTFPTGEQATIFTDNAYDNVPKLLQIVQQHNIKAVILVTDPHKFTQIWFNARTIRAQVPIIYWNLWDSNLLPFKDSKRVHYNQWIYESCDSLPCISQQSENFVRQIIDALPSDRIKPRVFYIPHGSDVEVYKPIEVTKARADFFRGKEYDFIAYYNSRNQTRKKMSDLVYAWADFYRALSPEQATKAALLMHTEPVSIAGTDLNELIASLAPNTNIILDAASRSPQDLNVLYNIADVTFCVSNAEGFGLSAQESLCAGTPIAATVTGGLQDSIGFFDEHGRRMEFSADFTSNSIGRYKNHGLWSYSIFPEVREIIGSPATPYLFNDCVSHQAITKALHYWHGIPRHERKRRGQLGREWIINQNMTSEALGESFAKEVGATIAAYKPTNLFSVYKA